MFIYKCKQHIAVFLLTVVCLKIKKMKKRILFLFTIFIPLLSFSQDDFKGMVMVKDESNAISGLPGASVYWLGTTTGVVSNPKGWFQIPLSPKSTKLVISYVGYKSDTVSVKKGKVLHHILREIGGLDEVVIKTRKQTTSTSFFAAMNTITINESELLKAACCNLSESFETNPAIDVSFSDALTGTKQLKMLGLKSPYLLITQENIPSVRGASQVFGMSFIPGTWIESIQVTKGMGSVVNGFESISGQINAELKKPRTKEETFVNLYASATGRLELNTHLTRKISKNWNSGLFVHGNQRTTKIDTNNDGFLDVPLAKQINIMNRWQYANPLSGWVSFIDFKYLKDEKQLGEVDFVPETDAFTTTSFGSEIKSQRFEAAAKLGYVFKEKPYQSIGVQTALSRHIQDSYFGFNRYDITHNSVYVNSIFQSILGSTQHKFKTGASFTHDGYVEQVNAVQYLRNENSVGSFFEYTYDNLGNFTLIAGIRLDYHTTIGTFVTPRLHLRYEPWEAGVFKFAVGKGKRIGNIFAENQKMFGSSRNILIEAGSNGVYGLQPEEAWNYGVSYLHKYSLFGREGSVAVDYFITDFVNQVVVDYDQSAQEVSFYNLNGSSTAKSFQLEINYELLNKLDLRFAYKNNDVKMNYKKGYLQKPLQPKNLFFANVGYETTKRKEALWKFDVTYNWLGEQRIPDTSLNPEKYQLADWSKAFSLVNAQVTYVISKKLEVYAGGENLTNVKQEQPILASEDPFGEYFDTTFVYAPIVGTMLYGGLRFKI
jgi:outer membrane receptor for ferrienterochelin and colicin